MNIRTLPAVCAAVALSSVLLLQGCEPQNAGGNSTGGNHTTETRVAETAADSRGLYIISDLDVQLFDDYPQEEFAPLISNIKKSRENFWLQINPDNSLTWHTLGGDYTGLPDSDGYYQIESNRFRLSTNDTGQRQLISPRSGACVRDCVIMLTLKQVTENSDDIHLVKDRLEIMSLTIRAGSALQIPAFPPLLQPDFIGIPFRISSSENSAVTLKLRPDDELTEKEPEEFQQETAREYLNWFHLPYRPENIRYFHYQGSVKYSQAMVLVIKDSDPLTDLPGILRTMPVTVYTEENGAVFYTPRNALTGMYYQYDSASRTLYLAIIPDGFSGVSEPFAADYEVIRTLNPKHAGAIVQESDFALSRNGFEQKYQHPLADYASADRLSSTVSKNLNELIASPAFFFRYPETSRNSYGQGWVDLSRISDYFREHRTILLISLHHMSLTERLAQLKTQYPQSRIYQDVFINDTPPLFYVLSETNTGLTLQYRLLEKETDGGYDNQNLMERVIIAQLLRQISPLDLDAIKPARMANFEHFALKDHYSGRGFNLTDDKQFIEFESQLIHADTGEVFISNPPGDHVIYTLEKNLIQGRSTNLDDAPDKLKLYNRAGELLVSGERFEFNQAGDAVIMTQCCGTGVFDLATREWLIKPQMALVTDHQDFYIARIQYRQPVMVIYSHQGKRLGSGTTIMPDSKKRQILLFDGFVDNGWWINFDGMLLEDKVQIEPVTVSEGTFYITRINDRIVVMNKKAEVIIPPFNFTAFKVDNGQLLLQPAHESGWRKADLCRAGN